MSPSRGVVARRRDAATVLAAPLAAGPMMITIALLLSMSVTVQQVEAASAGDILKAVRYKRFKLQLPVAASSGSGVKTISSNELSTYSDEYFFVRGNTEVVLVTPPNGARTSGSQHPRTELREVDWNGQDASWGITGGTRWMSFSGAVKVLGAGQVTVIAQVKGADNEPMELRVEADGSGKFAKVVGWYDDLSGSSPEKRTILDKYGIGQSYNITVTAGNKKVTIEFVSGQTRASVTYPYKKPLSSGCYFKVGNYLQTNVKSEVTLTRLELS